MIFLFLSPLTLHVFFGAALNTTEQKGLLIPLSLSLWSRPQGSFYLYQGSFQIEAVPPKAVALGIAGQRFISQMYHTTCRAFFDPLIKYAHQILKLITSTLRILFMVNTPVTHENVLLSDGRDFKKKERNIIF